MNSFLPALPGVTESIESKEPRKDSIQCCQVCKGRYLLGVLISRTSREEFQNSLLTSRRSTSRFWLLHLLHLMLLMLKLLFCCSARGCCSAIWKIMVFSFSELVWGLFQPKWSQGRRKKMIVVVLMMIVTADKCYMHERRWQPYYQRLNFLRYPPSYKLI